MGKEGSPSLGEKKVKKEKLAEAWEAGGGRERSLRERSGREEPGPVLGDEGPRGRGGGTHLW